MGAATDGRIKPQLRRPKSAREENLTMRPIKMTAKRAGKCLNCSGTINVGQSIYWQRGAGACHANCAYAKMENTICHSCNGSGLRWNQQDCTQCQGAGKRQEQPNHADRFDLDYEDACARACGL